MAVNYFTFGGIKSSDYGIYISGEGVFNAPKRDVEKYSIPGRNGDFILDNGRFENIEVRYPVFNYEKNLSDFETKLANFRNALSAKKGYQRLTDTFHADEYRMAAFVEGVEVVPIKYNTASEFEIVFNCKPQRFLTSGETTTAVASGGSVSNPTLFESKPLLEVVGHGTINLGGEDIILNDVKFVNVDYPYGQTPQGSIKARGLDDGRLNVGDTVTASNVKFAYSIEFHAGYTVTGHSITVQSSDFAYALNINRHGRFLVVTISASSISMAYSASTVAKTVVVSGYINYTDANGTAGTLAATGTAMFQIYDGAEVRLNFGISTANNNLVTRAQDVTCGGVSALSTVSVLGGTSYIDCEDGMAYRLINSLPVSINKAVTLPAELPTLKPGSNTITYSGAITSFKIAPRWWKV